MHFYRFDIACTWYFANTQPPPAPPCVERSWALTMICFNVTLLMNWVSLEFRADYHRQTNHSNVKPFLFLLNTKYFLSGKLVTSFVKFCSHKTNTFLVQFFVRWRHFSLWCRFFLNLWNEITRSDFKSKSLWLKASKKVSHDNEFIESKSKGFFWDVKEFSFDF